MDTVPVVAQTLEATMSENEDTASLSHDPHVEEALDEAESLLQFASETGFDIDHDSRENILEARAKFHKGLDEQTVAKLLVALGKVADKVWPVTPESLKACKDHLGRRHPHQKFFLIMAAIVILISAVSFVTSAIAESIRSDITTANALAVKLTSEFEPTAVSQSSSVHFVQSRDDSKQSTQVAGQTDSSISSLPVGVSRADVIRDLQQYAACIRNIDTHAQELAWYTHLYDRLFHRDRIDPFNAIRGQPDKLNEAFELTEPTINYGQAAIERTQTYQKVRCFAQNMVDDVSFYYGAVSSCILPVFYSLLGAAAYLLRSFVREVTARSYIPSSASEWARLLTAAIAGAVVGLFSAFMGNQSVKVPPLALAFLVGYAVDVFYNFLEHLIQSVTKTVISSSSEKRTSKSAAMKESSLTA